MTNKLFKLIACSLVAASVVACGPGEKKSEKAKAEANAIANADKSSLFNIEHISDKEAIKGGTLKVAVVNSEPAKGIFNVAFYDDNIDWEFIKYITPSIFKSNGDFNIVDGGMANMKLDSEKNIINVKFREGLKWEDGHPITVDDLIFYYEVVASKDYNGVRFDDSMRNVIGVKEYHQGKAKTIKGLEKVSDTELNIHVEELNPQVLTGGGGLTTYLLPKHYLKDVSVEKMTQSDKSRIKPLSYGPYKMVEVIPGESVQYVPNEYWYEEETKPQVDKMIVKILSDSLAVSSMKVGEFDVYANIPSDTYTEYKDFDNLAVLGRQALYYSYMGFNLGHWDEAKKMNVTDPDKKMADLRLRQAMLLSIDLDGIATQFFHGLREKANSLIPPIFKEYSIKGDMYKRDLDRANKLLDEAGYKYVDGEKYRRGKDGKEFVIYMAFPTYGIAEPLSQKFIQDFAEIGLKVELVGGRLMGANFFDVVQSNKGYDIWFAAWGVGTSFDYSGLYSKNAKFNMARLVDEEFEKIIAETESKKALEDKEYRKEMIVKANKYYMEKMLGFAPLHFKYDLFPYNKRIKQVSASTDDADLMYQDALTSPEPFKATE